MQTGRLVRGSARLAVDAVDGVTGIVEGMYRNIAALSPPLGAEPSGPARGIAGLVHAAIRSGTRETGRALDALLASLERPLDELAPPGPAREAAVSAINGVLGDHLEASGNPLAIEMAFRREGIELRSDASELAETLACAGPVLLITLHGLCMSDRQWRHRGHDHAEQLATTQRMSRIDLRYNSGRHVSDNGSDFAHRLQALVEAWPVPPRSITLLCHSMGGLVARSAIAMAEAEGLAWRRSLRAVAFLGTPHRGAPLERGGDALNRLALHSPYTAPLARLGWIRSAGITDLRHGSISRDDWNGRDRFREPLCARRLPPPAGVRCLCVAASLGPVTAAAPRSDGLVPVASALGLPVADDQQLLRHRRNHWQLLSDPVVSDFLADRLGTAMPAA